MGNSLIGLFVAVKEIYGYFQSIGEKPLPIERARAVSPRSYVRVIPRATEIKAL